MAIFVGLLNDKHLTQKLKENYFYVRNISFTIEIFKVYNKRKLSCLKQKDPKQIRPQVLPKYFTLQNKYIEILTCVAESGPSL